VNQIVAIYARKSTEQSAAEEAKSVTRQIEHAHAYAVRKGWTVDDSRATFTRHASTTPDACVRLAAVIPMTPPKSPLRP
jgi:hypothetical protein